jgi:putative membrane protein
MCIDATEAMTWWTADPLAIGVVTLSSSIYVRGLRAVWGRSTRLVGGGAARGIRRWEAASFFAGQLALLVALVSPVDRLSDLLFSAHMTQHELIMLVAPPLIVLGRPWVALLWALPDAARLRLGKALHAPRLVSAWRISTGPLLVVLLHGLVVWLWHVPALFEAAMRSEAVHSMQHASFFGTAALFWWAILRGRYGRAGYGLAVGFVFATAMHTSILGALITVARSLWYPIYAARGAAWQLDALEDQTLAGLVMWIPAGVLLTLVALALFGAWLGEAARRVAIAERRRSS